jgi:archaellum component FlaF (FlaF/FlaG flagellin family)
MKGISTILAMILIVIIVVALIGMTYTFAVGLFSTTANATQQQTNQVTSNMGKTVAIASAKCNPGANYQITLRNTGSNTIGGGELSAFVDGTLININFGAGLTSGQIAPFTSTAPTAFSDGKSHTLRVSAPAGEVEAQVTC